MKGHLGVLAMLAGVFLAALVPVGWKKLRVLRGKWRAGRKLWP